VTAHVAEAGEGRGRVVLRFSVGDANPLAIAAAVRVAQAFNSEVESLFIEDTQVLDLASHPFVREISFAGRHNRALTEHGLHQSFMAAFVSARRAIQAEALAAEVPLRERVVRDEPIHALAAACAQNGPWNVIALAEAFGTGTSVSIREIFENVSDATGLVMVGPKASRSVGPVVVVVEDLERLQGMLRAADRIGKLSESPTVLLLLADDENELHQLDGEIRLVLGDRKDVAIAVSTQRLGNPAVAAEALRRLRGGFVIARFGGLAVPGEGGWRPLVSTLECPLLLVR